ncbi:MAG: DUF58 domain-containing protein [Pseudomonadota bacterium]
MLSTLKQVFDREPADHQAQHGNAQASHGDGIHLSLDELLQIRHHARERSSRRRKRTLAPRTASQRSRALGRGLDFAEARVYQPGDDVRLIDWNVTARTNVVHTKLFEQEKERPVFFVVDFGRTMRFGTRRALKSIVAARLATQLAWTYAATGERIGGVVVNETRHIELKPLSSTRGTLALIRTLVDMHRDSLLIQSSAAQLANPGYFSSALARLRALAHPGSTVVVVSDFANLDATDQQHLRWLSLHTECIAARTVDRVERALPNSGRFAISDGEHHTEFDAGDARLQRSHKSNHARISQNLVDLFSGAGNFCVELTSEDNYTDVAHSILNRDPEFTLIRRDDRA